MKRCLRPCAVKREIEIEKIRRQVRCPYCGYRMPMYYKQSAQPTGVFVRYKGRDCKKEFEVVLTPDKQYHYVPMSDFQIEAGDMYGS